MNKIELTKNFLFTGLKLKLHGVFTKLELIDTFRKSHSEVFNKNLFRKISQASEKIYLLESLLMKLLL